MCLIYSVPYQNQVINRCHKFLDKVFQEQWCSCSRPITLVGSTWKFKVFLSSSLKLVSPLTGISFPSAICAKKPHGNFQLNTWAVLPLVPGKNSVPDQTILAQSEGRYPKAAPSFHPDSECTRMFQLSQSGRHWESSLHQALTHMRQMSIAV